MKYFKEIKDKIYNYKELGFEVSELGAILIGKAPHIARLAWLHSLYPILDDNDTATIEHQLNMKIPADYLSFLSNCSNGLSLFVSEFYLDGYRKILGRNIEASRQPYSLLIPNVQFLLRILYYLDHPLHMDGVLH